MIQLVKSAWAIDDSLDVFAVHGVGGMTGSLALAVLIHPALGGHGCAAGFDIGRQLLGQALGVGVVALWSAVASVVLGLGLAKILPMRVTSDEEREGLDLSYHGERAWEMD